MRLAIYVDLDNDAFGPSEGGRLDGEAEIAAVLASVPTRGLEEGRTGILRERNGNTVGYWEVRP